MSESPRKSDGATPSMAQVPSAARRRGRSAGRDHPHLKTSPRDGYPFTHARMAGVADLKSVGPKGLCRLESGHPHQLSTRAFRLWPRISAHRDRRKQSAGWLIGRPAVQQCGSHREARVASTLRIADRKRRPPRETDLTEFAQTRGRRCCPHNFPRSYPRYCSYRLRCRSIPDSRTT